VYQQLIPEEDSSSGLTKALKEFWTLEFLFPKLMSFPVPKPDDLQQLEVLTLNRCQRFTSLPTSFGSLQCLATLVLSSCTSLFSLPDLDLATHIYRPCNLMSVVSFNGPFQHHSTKQLPSQF
jgi:hypothetical protein